MAKKPIEKPKGAKTSVDLPAPRDPYLYWKPTIPVHHPGGDCRCGYCTGD